MQIESAPDVRQNSYEHTPRLTTLYALLTVFVAMYADYASDHVQAQEPKGKVVSTSTAGLQKPTPLDDLKQTLDAQKPLLNDVKFEVRQKAQATIQKAIRDALNYRNPLPPEARQWMRVPHEVNGAAETFRRMENTAGTLLDMESELPGRIEAPNADKPLSTILEKHLHCKIEATDPVLQAKLRTYNVGTDGESSDGAFLRLCTELNAIPVPTHHGFLLRPQKDGEEVKIQGSIVATLLNENNIIHREVFLMPDKGTILTVVDDLKNTDGNTLVPVENLQHFDFTPTVRANASFHPWTISDGQQTPQSFVDIPPTHKTFRAMVGILPFTLEVTSGTKGVFVGGQYLVMNAGEKELYGSWNTKLEGTMWNDLEWPDTTNEEDMYGYQLLAANRIVGIDANGKEMDTVVRELNFCKRDFSMNVRTPECPASFKIRAFTHLQEAFLTLPQ